MRRIGLFILVALVLTGCGVSRVAANRESEFKYWLERSYESEMYQQDRVMMVDAQGDALLIRKLDTAFIKLTSYLFHNNLPQAVSGRERQSADPDFKIGRTNPLDNEQLLNQFMDVIQDYYPAITPELGEEHEWSPEAKRYNLYGYWHRLGRRISGRQKDFPAPFFMRSKLLMCLACGWTSRYCITGTEETLIERIMSYPDYSLQLSELFAESYLLNRGNVYMSLLACENVLTGQPHRTERDDDPMQRKLAYIRNDSKPLGDNYGAWYHFFGIALYGILRSSFTSVFVANTESFGSFFMEGADHQETLINHYGALFGHQFRKRILLFLEQTAQDAGCSAKDAVTLAALER